MGKCIKGHQQDNIVEMVEMVEINRFDHRKWLLKAPSRTFQQDVPVK